MGAQGSKWSRNTDMSIITTLIEIAVPGKAPFTQPELRGYIQEQLGEGFVVSNGA